jgi:quercetin dioxygenase-like cupin family protein
MNVLNAHAAALEARSADANRPASAVLHDALGVRLVVFRIEPGQRVAPHVAQATVLLTVLSGRGFISGAADETAVEVGTVVAFAPGELHGMRADDERLCLLATIVRTA